MSLVASSSRTNPLYRLAQPGGGVELPALESDELRGFVDEFATDAFVEPGQVCEVLREYDRLSGNGDPRAAAVGLAAFAQLVDWWAHQPEERGEQASERPRSDDARELDERARELNALLTAPGVADYFRCWYHLDTDAHGVSLGKNRVCLTRDPRGFPTIDKRGTTSFIVKCKTESGQTTALKCLLPRYTTSLAMRGETKNYATGEYGEHAASVIASNECWILMHWVEGETLHDHRLLKPTDAAEGRFLETESEFDDLYELSTSLVAILDDLYCKAEVAHLDLSPSNLIVRTLTPSGLTLIDFGMNFLVQEGVGRPKDMSSATLYMAPEVERERFKVDEHTTLEAKTPVDLYSLGVIFLQVLARGRVQEESFTDHLRALWEVAPGWARIIEDLTDGVPEMRLADWRKDGKFESPYGYLKARIDEQRAEIQIFGLAERNGEAAGIPNRFRWFSARSFDVPRRLHDAGLRIGGGRYSGLARWSAISIGGWVMTVAIFLMFTSADLGSPNALTESWHTLFAGHLQYSMGVGSPDGHWHNFFTNLPGRLVGLTFGMCAAAYYMNIFATLELNGLNLAHRRVRRAAFFMRACAIWPWLPIFVTLLWNPHWWPWMSAAGCVSVIGNNRIMWKLASDAQTTEADAAKESELQTRFDEKFVEEYREWWSLMAVLGGFLLLTGILIYSHSIPDTWFLAVVVIGVNYVKLYRLNSYKLAPRVRGNLQRSLFILGRQPPPLVAVDEVPIREVVSSGSEVSVVADGLSSRPLPKTSRWVLRVLDEAAAVPERILAGWPLRELRVVLQRVGRRVRVVLAHAWGFLPGTVAFLVVAAIGHYIAHAETWFALVVALAVGTVVARESGARIARRQTSSMDAQPEDHVAESVGTTGIADA